MNSPRISRVSRTRLLIVHAVSASLLLQFALPASAAITDIDTIPLGTYNAAPPRANLMFILDDSGSMDRAYVPELSSGGAAFTGLCYGYSNLNKLFYDPYTEYVLPPKANFTADGNYTSDGLSSVKGDGFDDASAKYNLSTAPTWSNGGNNPYYYTKATTTLTTCDTSKLSRVTSLDNIAAAKDAAGNVIDQKKNFAIWFSFYRTRMLAMRSAAGRVLSSIDATKFRVGFSTINETGSTNNGKEFHHLGDFDGPSSDDASKTTRTRIMEKIYATVPSGSTPLRPALVKAGRYYANNASAIQYTCQRSYALLTTDGYWNTAAESKNYIPLDKSGTAFTSTTGDSGQPLPFGDGYPYTLADIAYYYNNTDLRTDLANNIPPTATDPNQFQHMTTYTLGLGVTGTIVYTPNYTDAQLLAALKAAPGGGWPTALTDPLSTSDNVPGRIDDLWHAAVNGRGRYYSASKPQEVVDSLKAALDQISAEVGLGAAATTSSIAPTVGDDQFFVPGYQHDAKTPWQGSLQAYTLKFDANKNIITPDLTKPDWAAQDLLNKTVPANRRILYSKGGTLSGFTYDNMTAANQALFDNLCATNATNTLSQCSTLTNGAKTKVTGDNVVKYLRGDASLYLDNAAADNRVFRTRLSILGDIVNSSPIAVGKPPFDYTDDGYSKFVTDNTNRQRMVYIGANDGMLHAFYATGTNAGKEAWAFVPTAVLSKLWKLADLNYDGNHLAFVDQTPTLADVKFADGSWHTVLVGGLGSGGRQYYAIDVTDPAAPKLLWEFGPGISTPADDAKNLGLTYGNPIVTKFTDSPNQWYAVFTSGFNNHLSGGDGKGYLYALDIEKGGKKFIVKTDEPGTGNLPTNFGKINAWIHADTNNTARRIYGGDMQGRMWRFEGLPNTAGPTVTLIGIAKDKDGKKQPITTRPVLTALAKDRAANDGAFVSFGTGKYLAPKDLDLEVAASAFSNTQSIYLINDPAQAKALDAKSTSRASGLKSLTPGATEASYTGSYVDQPGFFVDLPDKGERVVIDGQQFNGLISFASSIPQTTANSDPCLTGGSSSLYYFNVRTGAYSKEAGVSLIVGGTRVFKAPGDGSEGGSIIWTTNKSTYKKDVSGVGGAAEGTKLRRSSWREIVE